MHMNDHLPNVQDLLAHSRRQEIIDRYAELDEPQNSEKWLAHLDRHAGTDEPHLNEEPANT
jgi:hypothetical protein